jgi:signal transduction histidine kinase
VVVVVQYLSQLTRRLSEQRERAEQALAGNVRLQREGEELAAQEERSRIAREIHDGIAQSIYMLTLNLEKAAEVASGDQKLGERLGKLVGLAKETLLEVRHYIFDLKPLLSGDVSLSSTIQSQVREFSTVSGLPVQLEVEGEERKVPLAVGSSLYRIAQEALANVYRHAEASAIDVRLAFCADFVSLEVRDNGCGFTLGSVSANGRGLRNIRQRVGELGGKVEITSAPGQGASLRVTLPIGE